MVQWFEGFLVRWFKGMCKKHRGTAIGGDPYTYMYSSPSSPPPPHAFSACLSFFFLSDGTAFHSYKPVPIGVSCTGSMFPRSKIQDCSEVLQANLGSTSLTHVSKIGSEDFTAIWDLGSWKHGAGTTCTGLFRFVPAHVPAI